MTGKQHGWLVAGVMVVAASGCSADLTGGDDAGGAGAPGSGGAIGPGSGGAEVNPGGGTGGAVVAGSGGEQGTSDAGAPPDSGAAGTGALPSGPTAGCMMPAPAGAVPGQWAQHKIDVSGVDPAYLPGGKQYGTQNGFDFTHRNYYLKLPAKYDPGRAYPLVMSGGGCGTTNGMSGNNGGSNALPDNQDFAIQVGLSYVYSANAGACFTDGYTNTPDLPYFDAVVAEVEKATCVDRGKVFMSGFSSGAWETYMLACARGGVIRGVGTQAGGLRSQRPPCSNIPVAAFLTAGTNDANPIHNVDAKTGFDSGSAPARDVILKTNGCVGTETAPYTSAAAPATWNCRSYTGCPKEYPVIWCEIPGGHGAGSPSAFWPFWNALPAR